MFLKPFRSKSNVAIKGSERKRLRSSLSNEYTGKLKDNEVMELLPNKEEMTVMKIYSHQGENVSVYCLRKNPILFEYDGILYPTVYTLWRYPAMVPLLTTHVNVIDKLRSGADLMLPGIITSITGLPDMRSGQAVSVNALGGSKASLAIGFSLMSSRDMVESAGMRGKGIKILHTFGDYLWAIGEKSQPPQIHDDEFSIETAMQSIDVGSALLTNESSDWFGNSDNTENCATSTGVTIAEHSTHSGETENGDSTIYSKSGNELNVDSGETRLHEVDGARFEDEKSETEHMDDLLHSCFMTALKKHLKDSELPILTSTFYRTHVLQCCPPGNVLDIKKTSHKKLSKYLRNVASTGLIQVKELSKGNDSITSLQRAHADLKKFKVPQVIEKIPEDLTNTQSSFGVITQQSYEPPIVSVVHRVSGTTLPLFSQMGIHKGAVLSLLDIRETVAKYIHKEELVSKNNPRMVTLDPILHNAMYLKDANHVTAATWEDVFKKVISRMQACHQLCFKGLPPVIKSGSLPSIEITVQQRASNKKVTLVKNLESFMIDPQQFSDVIRKKAQASTSLSSLPSGAASSAAAKVMQQVLIQGNQVGIVEQILTGSEYKLPKKYIRGLNLAPKPKKKGR